MIDDLVSSSLGYYFQNVIPRDVGILKTRLWETIKRESITKSQLCFRSKVVDSGEKVSKKLRKKLRQRAFISVGLNK